MKKNYKAPEIGITIFGKENDVMTASGNAFIDKNTDQPSEWDEWIG